MVISSPSKIEMAVEKLLGHKWVELGFLSPLEGEEEEVGRCRFCNIRRITWSSYHGKPTWWYYISDKYAESTMIEPLCTGEEL